MTKSTKLEDEFKILEPFLFSYGFYLADIEPLQGSSGLFTRATYVNGKKNIIICIKNKDSIETLDYKFENYSVMHGFYVDEICNPNDRNYCKMQPTFERKDLQTQLKEILSDFEYLIDDFFVGQCIKLKKSAEFQNNFYKELQAKLYADDELKNNKEIINKARQQFKIKNYKDCIAIYKTVSKNYVLTEFDKKTLQHCTDHLTT